MPTPLSVSKDSQLHINSEMDIPKDFVPLVESAIENQESFNQENFNCTPRKIRYAN